VIPVYYYVTIVEKKRPAIVFHCEKTFIDDETRCCCIKMKKYCHIIATFSEAMNQERRN
jgi:hypothetical protein